jgi:hypothetical protein
VAVLLIGSGALSTASPARVGAATGTFVAPSYLGQHLMFDSTLNPAFPVHAMRLWDSNTAWCQMDWGTSANQYDFWQLDNLFGQASRAGADLEFTFGDTPQWAAAGAYPQPTQVTQCNPATETSPPARESYWKNFVTAVVTHGKGKIHAYELWNEFNTVNYWNGGIQRMVQMSIDAANIIHRIDPAALVLSPSITNTSYGYQDLQQYLGSLPQGTINGIAVHSYTASSWPEDALPAEMASIRAALPRAYAGYPIWSTEGGWGANSWFSSAGGSQAAFVARYDLQMLSQGFARSYWYAYPNSQWGTLLDESVNPPVLTQAGIASGTVYNWLAGGTLGGCSSADGNLWTCGLTMASGASAQIAWVKTTPASYSTAFATLQSLAGGTQATGGSVSLTTEPVLLS